MASMAAAQLAAKVNWQDKRDTGAEDAARYQAPDGTLYRVSWTTGGTAAVEQASGVAWFTLARSATADRLLAVLRLSGVPEAHIPVEQKLIIGSRTDGD
jgi:hypothetical protein